MNKNRPISIVKDWPCNRYSYIGPIGKDLSISIFDWHYGKMKDVPKRFASYQEAKNEAEKYGYIIFQK